MLLSLSGLITGIFLTFTGIHWLIKGLLLVIPLLFGIKRKKILFLSLGILSGFIATGLQARHPSFELSCYPHSNIEKAQGIILSSKYSAFSTEYVVKIHNIPTPDNTKNATAKIILKTSDRKHLSYFPGSSLTMERLSLCNIPPPKNPGGFDRRRHLSTKGIYLQGEAKKMSVGPRKDLLFLFRIIRQSVIRRIDAAFLYFPEEKELLKTITLGQENIPYFLRTAGIQSGTYHLLVISGLHIGFLLLFLKILFIPFAELNNRRPKLFPSLALILLWLYGGITGFRVPVVRAVLMASLFFAGEILERDIDILSSIMASAFFLLIVSPYNLTDASFQLSFITTTGIVLFWQRFQLSNRKYIISIILTSISAQAAATPVLLYHFGCFYPVGLINNIFFVPLTGIVVMLSFISFIVPLLFPVARVLLTLFYRMAALSAPLSPPVHLEISIPSILAFYSLFLFLIYTPRRKSFSTGLLLFFSLSLLSHFAPKPEKAIKDKDICYFLSLSKPSVVYIKQDAAICFLADHYQTTEIENIVIPLLNKHKISNISLFYTKASWSHTNTFNTLAKHFPALKVYDPDIIKDFPAYPYLDIFYYKSHPSLFTFCSAQKQKPLPGLSVEYAGEDNGSLSYIITDKQYSILIAPFIGNKVAEAINGKAFNILYAADIKKTKKINESLDSASFQHLIVPDKYKKFEPVMAQTEGQTLCLKNSAVKFIPKNKTPHISYYYE